MICDCNIACMSSGLEQKSCDIERKSSNKVNCNAECKITSTKKQENHSKNKQRDNV